MSPRPFCRLAVLGLIGGLAGCGSGGSEPLPDFDDNFAPIIEVQALNESETLGTDLPTTGQADYAGAMWIFFRDDVGVNTGVQVAGQATMTVDFGSNGFTGSATNFVSPNDAQFAGTMTIGANDSVLNRPDDFSIPQVVADVSGTLTDPDDRAYATTLTLSGGFLNGTDLFFGGMTGTYDTGEGPRPAEGTAAGQIAP